MLTEIQEYSSLIRSKRDKIIAGEKLSSSDHSELDKGTERFINWQIATDFERKESLENIIDEFLSELEVDKANYRKEHGRIIVRCRVKDPNKGLIENSFYIDGFYYRIKTGKSLLEKTLASDFTHRGVKDYEGVTFVVRHKSVPFLDFWELLAIRDIGILKKFIDDNETIAPKFYWKEAGFDYDSYLGENKTRARFDDIFREFLGAYDKIFGRMNEKACYKFAKRFEKIAINKGFKVEDLHQPTIYISKFSRDPRSWRYIKPIKATVSRQILTNEITGATIDSYVIACSNNKATIWLAQKIRRKKGIICTFKENTIYIQSSTEDVTASENKYYVRRFRDKAPGIKDRANAKEYTFLPEEMLEGWNCTDVPVDNTFLTSLAGNYFEPRLRKPLKARDYIKGAGFRKHKERGYKSLHYTLQFLKDEREFKIRDNAMEIFAIIGKSSEDRLAHDRYREERYSEYQNELIRLLIAKGIAKDRLRRNVGSLERYYGTLLKKQIEVKYRLLREHVENAFNPMIADRERHLALIPVIYSSIVADIYPEAGGPLRELRGSFDRVFKKINSSSSEERGSLVAILRNNAKIIESQYPQLYYLLNSDGEYQRKLEEAYLRAYVSITLGLVGHIDKFHKLAGYGLLTLYPGYNKHFPNNIDEAKFRKLTSRLVEFHDSADYREFEGKIRRWLIRIKRLDNFARTFYNRIHPILIERGADEYIIDKVHDALYSLFRDVTGKK